MSPNLVALLYLVAGVLFILALRGLSSPDSSRRGNLFGMIGMTIAVLTTLGAHPPASQVAWGLVIGGIAVGGGIGAGIARRVPMTSMPELVAAFHSLVGMGAGVVGGSRHRLHARKFGADHHRSAGRLLGCDPVLHYVQGHEPLVRLRHSWRIRRRNCGARYGRRAAAGQAWFGRGRRLHHEEFLENHHRARLRHGGGASPTSAARNWRQTEEKKRWGPITHS